MSVLSVTILTVGLSTGWQGYVGVYAEMDHCRDVQALIAHEEPGAVIVCETKVVGQPVLRPPPRPAGLRVVREPVLIPPIRPSNLGVSQ
jgi:hypothetical protein